jgi:hypothetical protein
VPRVLPGGSISAPTQGLPVDCHHLFLDLLLNASNPPSETILKSFRIDPTENAAQHVVRGNPVFKRQQFLQPFQLCLPELLGGNEGVSSADRSTDYQQNNLVKRVGLPVAGILQFLEAFDQGGRIGHR